MGTWESPRGEERTRPRGEDSWFAMCPVVEEEHDQAGCKPCEEDGHVVTRSSVGVQVMSTARSAGWRNMNEYSLSASTVKSKGFS